MTKMSEDNAPENRCIIFHITLTMLKKRKTYKILINTKHNKSS